MNTVYLHIGQQTYYCPQCGTDISDELESIGDIGCSGCGRKFDIEEEEDLYERKVRNNPTNSSQTKNNDESNLEI